MTKPLDRPGSIRRLSTGLIAYGLIGLGVAAIGLAALAWVNGRVTDLRSDVETTLAREAGTMQVAAVVLHDAAATAQSFTGTVGQSSQVVSSAGATVAQVRSDLGALEAQLRSVSILGATPLSSPADAVARIAGSMVGLDGQMALVADSMLVNRDTLVTTAASLGRLGDAADSYAARLRSGVIEDSLGDLQRVISVTLLVITAWFVLPAVGALALGIWLRREAGPSGSG